jgi:hypothetical protein
MAFGSSGNFAWVSTVGGVVGGEGLISIAYGLAVDLDGTVWTVGRFYGRADFDPGEEAIELTASGDSDAFVARYTADIGALRVTPLPE